MTVGVTDYGVALPTYHVTADAYEEIWDRFAARIDRKTVTAYDEDAVTMATAAGTEVDAAGTETLAVATTSHPQPGTLASGPLARALGLHGPRRTLEFGHSWKAGLEALDAGLSFGSAVVLASDDPDAPRRDEAEHVLGAGAASVVVGDDAPVATVAGSAHHVDARLPAKFRTDERVTDLALGGYTTEGFTEALSIVVDEALAEAGCAIADVDHAVLPQDDVKTSWRGGQRLGFDADQMRAGFVVSDVGFAGVASPLLGLAAALDAADVGARILLAGYGYGHGASAFVFEATSEIAEASAGVETAVDATERLRPAEYTRLREASS
jgi:3-hydroxy-3-methylglutaryl CoA synthase